jgi:hypothetical protein
MQGLILKAALAALLLTTQAAASNDGNVFGIAADNDVFIPNGTDRYYTHGTRFSLRQPAGSRPFWGGIPLDRLPIWPKGAALVPESGISQLIFTPARIDRLRPNPNDRPYAGMAAFSMGYTGVAPQPEHGPQRIDQFTLTVGIIGPAALAGEAQRLVHRVQEGVMPLGWRSQLGTEPAVNVAWRRGWRFSGPHFDVTPHAGAAMGNVHIHAEAGVTLRVGAGLADLAPGTIDPVQPGLPGLQDTQQLKMHLVAGVDGRAVARNLFIDGNSFTDGRGTVREDVVGEARIGLVARWRGAQISYLYNWRSREFLRQRDIHRYGSIALAVRL